MEYVAKTFVYLKYINKAFKFPQIMNQLFATVCSSFWFYKQIKINLPTADQSQPQLNPYGIEILILNLLIIIRPF